MRSPSNSLLWLSPAGKSPRARTINLATNHFRSRHIFCVFHPGKLGRSSPEGKLTPETIAFVHTRLAPLHTMRPSRFFAANFLTRVFLKGLRLERISYSVIYGFCLDLEKALDVVMCKSQDVKPEGADIKPGSHPAAGPKCGRAANLSGTGFKSPIFEPIF